MLGMCVLYDMCVTVLLFAALLRSFRLNLLHSVDILGKFLVTTPSGEMTNRYIDMLLDSRYFLFLGPSVHIS